MKRSFKKFIARLDAIGLRAKIEKQAIALHVSLSELYEGTDRAPRSIAAARRSIYLWLMGEGKSYNEVAKLFDRSPHGVWKVTKKVRK